MWNPLTAISCSFLFSRHPPQLQWQWAAFSSSANVVTCHVGCCGKRRSMSFVVPEGGSLVTTNSCSSRMGWNSERLNAERCLHGFIIFCWYKSFKRLQSYHKRWGKQETKPPIRLQHHSQPCYQFCNRMSAWNSKKSKDNDSKKSLYGSHGRRRAGDVGRNTMFFNPGAILWLSEEMTSVEEVSVTVNNWQSQTEKD